MGTCKTILWCTGFNYEGKASMNLTDCDMSKHGWTKIRDVEVEYEEPQRASIVAAQVLYLDAQIEDEYIKCEEHVAEFKRQRAELLAIENAP